jgi:hypothetical protein
MLRRNVLTNQRLQNFTDLLKFTTVKFAFLRTWKLIFVLILQLLSHKIMKPAKLVGNLM